MNGIWTSWVFVCLVNDGDSYVKSEDLDHINQFNMVKLIYKSLWLNCLMGSKLSLVIYISMVKPVNSILTLFWHIDINGY
jgi:hypothetical protein